MQEDMTTSSAESAVLTTNAGASSDAENREIVAVAPGNIYVKRLREWALDFNIAHVPIRALLAISKPIVPQLPADPRTLLGVAYDLKVAPMGSDTIMSQLPLRQLPARQRRSAIDEAIYLLEGEGISWPEPQVDADDSFDTIPLGDDTLTTVPKVNGQEDILLLMCKHMRAQSMKLDILVETVRKLLGRQRLLESMIQQHAKTSGPVASQLPRDPLDHQLRSGVELRNMNVQLLDKSFRQKLTSFLTCLRGQNIDEFVKRIFFAVFDDEISLYVNFKGRKTKESLCGSKLETEFRSRSAGNAVETVGPVLDSILFPAAAVERELKNLKEAKSSGPDNIPAKFLKELANELSKPLAHIFRSSFELGRLPSEWKTANIFPIYKGGARTNANNYRPARAVAAGFWWPKQTYSITAGMIKSISIEQKFYDRCCTQSPPCPGIVLGGLNKDEECIFFLLAATGQEYTEPAAFGSIDAIDADRLRDQCKKISRMLPAGIHISGLYFSEAADLKSQSENHIKKVSTKTGLFFKLLKIIRDCDKHNPFGPSHPDVEKAYLQVEPKTRKITAKVIGFTPTKDFFRPVDVKVKPTIDRWRAIKTHITLSIETHLPSERQRETIMEQLKKAADPYLHAINSETRLLVNNALRGPEEPLFSVKSRESNRPGSQTKSRTQKRHTLPKEKFPHGRQESCPTTLWEPLDFTLFGPDFPCWHRTSSCSSIDSGASSEAFSADSGCPLVPSETKKNLLIQGRIPGIAFLPVNGTLVEHALQAFRDDLTHSILMRLELLSEELNVTSGEMEG
nr:unnamed protein product [Spirometra erinaceieuropaei]